MKNTINELLKNPKIENIKQLTEEVKKLSGSKWSNKRIRAYIEKLLLENVEYKDYLIKENGKLCKKEVLFAKTKFKIKLTNREINKKQLIIGHRFIPFISENFTVEDIKLTDSKSKKLKQKKEEIHFSDAMIFFSFFEAGHISYLQDFRNEHIITSYFDLKDWFKDNKFTESDYLQIQVINFENNEYKLEKISSREYNTQRLVFDQRDEKFENSILNIIRTEEIPSPVFSMFFKAYADFDEEAIIETGIPLAGLINTSEVIDTESISGIPFFIEAGTTIHERFADVEMPELGKAKDLDGIFNELGYSFSEVFVKALIIQQLKTGGNIDVDKILSIVLKKEYDFINEKQADNFEKAFIKVLNKTVSTWDNIQIEKPVFELLETCINIEKTTNKLLRAIDNYLNANPHLIDDFDFSIIDPFRQIEMTAEEMIIFIINGKAKLPTIDVKEISKQLSGILKNIKVDIDKIIESYS